MPKTIYFSGGIAESSDGDDGIDITWVASKQRLDIHGWFDGFVGIEGGSITLREFFDRLGIKERDCKRAFNAED